MAISATIRETFQQNEGILRLRPVFVPRRFGRSGGRLRLHPHDYYALGTPRGSIKERWFSSVIPAMNGPLAPEDEGLSYCEPSSGGPDDAFTLRDAVQELGSELIGYELMNKYGTWPMYSKFFDYADPLFHHLHLNQAAAKRVGRIGKPECYYYPPQLNNHPGTGPYTYYGFDPDASIDQVRRRLLEYRSSDNRITELSRAYRIELATGWYTPPGVVHAPGSYLTYEPQWNSDVNSVYENVAWGEVYPHDFLVENVPEDRKEDVDYVLSLMDWERNTDPHYKRHYFRPPIVASESEGSYVQKWIAYGNDYVAAQELTILPGKAITHKGPVAFGCIVVQGHGIFGRLHTEAAGMLRYGQPSADEFFVSERTARAGFTIRNASPCEPMVILKHFGPNNPFTPKAPF